MNSYIPTIHTNNRIAIILESPDREAEYSSEWFTSPTMKFLEQVLSRANIIPKQCYVSSVYPTSELSYEQLGYVSTSNPIVQQRLSLLQSELSTYKPNLVLLIGALAYKCAKGDSSSLDSWRGSLFRGCGVFDGYKCMGTFSPVRVTRDYATVCIWRMDMHRAHEQSAFPELYLPVRSLLTRLSCQEICQRLDYILAHKPHVSVDIEGGIPVVTKLSISIDPSEAFLIPFVLGDGQRYWSIEDEMLIWPKLSKVLRDHTIPKVLQNYLYDSFVLAFMHQTPILGLADDTMLLQWELYSELEKGLGFLCSMWTYEPFYKDDRKSDSPETANEYCCKDSATTLEIRNEQHKELSTQSEPIKQHYEFNKRLLRPLLYMQLRGMKYDTTKRDFLLRVCGRAQARLQRIVNRIAGKEINVKSVKFKDYLYKEQGLPVQLDKKTKSPTANELALLRLASLSKHPILKPAIKLRQIRTRVSSLEKPCDPDGRMRCSYNVVGTETGRLTCYTSNTGNGDNLQTITSSHRVLYTADTGYYFFQCDLSGADGWTVAAHCARHGDPTMLEDYKFGLKPAKILALFCQGILTTNNISREDLKALIKKTEGEGRLKEDVYFACKCTQHGTNYGMFELTLCDIIFKQSDGEVVVDKHTAKRYQNLYRSRYPGIAKWHKDTEQRIASQGYIISASGHKRLLFGRRGDANTLRAALSNEPQENTTYATNLALEKLYYDKENRTPKGNFIIEPLHQVHDALNGQFRKEHVDFAKRKIYEYFNNPLTIAGITLTIPFEGYYGSSWGGKEFKL